MNLKRFFILFLVFAALAAFSLDGCRSGKSRHDKAKPASEAVDKADDAGDAEEDQDAEAGDFFDTRDEYVEQEVEYDEEEIVTDEPEIRIRDLDFKNHTFQFEDGVFRFRNGAWQDPQAPEAAGEIKQILYGQLLRNGREQAVVAMSGNWWGGNFVSNYIQVFDYHDGKAWHVGQTIEGLEAKVNDNELLVTNFEFDAAEPMYKAKKITHTYRWSKNKFVELQQ